jgi:hypothetical protein
MRNIKIWPIFMKPSIFVEVFAKFSRKREFARKVEPKDFTYILPMPNICAKKSVETEILYLYYFREYCYKNVCFSWGRILERNPDNGLKSFILAFHSHLYSFALRFLFLTQPFTVSTVHCKEERRKTCRKPYPLPYGVRNPYRNLKLRTPKIMPRNLNEIVRSWILLLDEPGGSASSCMAAIMPIGHDKKQLLCECILLSFLETSLAFKLIVMKISFVFVTYHPNDPCSKWSQ